MVKKLFSLLLLVCYVITMTPISALAATARSPYDAEYYHENNKKVTYPGTVTTNGGTLNVRNGPGTDCESIGKLDNGTRVKIAAICLDDETSPWIYISSPKKGWVHQDYIEYD